ncbi:MAG: alkaline phosphatase family protein [Chitinophagaceae bacterium]|nr:alkaline phosphatase family protein [Chitinophagaceae bacterium]
MKKRLTIICLCLLAVRIFATGQSVRHVVLISIDGFRPDMYLDKSWPTPNLQLLMQQGTYAKHLKSVFPAYTYPAHAAMVTGALPARSGICYNQPKNSKGEWNWFMDSIKAPTIWQVLKKSGMTTASVEWPPSVGKDITWDIPEIWDSGPNGGSDRITEARKYATPGLIEEVEQNATGKLDSNSMNEEYLSLDEQAARAAGYIFRTHKPSFLAVHFACVDGMQHGYGRDHDSVKLAAACNDHAIGDMLEAIQRSGLKESTAVIIVGDHGFSTINQAFRPNLLIKDIDARFIAAGGSAFLYRSSISTVSNADLIKVVTEKLNTLPNEKRRLFRIIDRKELDEMGVDSAALIALSAEPGLVFSGSTKPAPVANHGPGTQIQQNELEGAFYTVSGGHHGYDPNNPQMYTGFIAVGAGIRKGGVIPDLCVTDIAPLIARLLEVPFTCPDGKLVKGIVSEN